MLQWHIIAAYLWLMKKSIGQPWEKSHLLVYMSLEQQSVQFVQYFCTKICKMTNVLFASDRLKYLLSWRCLLHISKAVYSQNLLVIFAIQIIAFEKETLYLLDDHGWHIRFLMNANIVISSFGMGSTADNFWTTWWKDEALLTS